MGPRQFPLESLSFLGVLRFRGCGNYRFKASGLRCDCVGVPGAYLPPTSRKLFKRPSFYFGDPDKAFEAVVALRWPNGITCPRCGSKEHSFISTRKIWFCKGCKKQFTVKVGSIFEDSPLGMDKWMFATWLL
jgi:hypothetical protein